MDFTSGQRKRRLFLALLCGWLLLLHLLLCLDPPSVDFDGVQQAPESALSRRQPGSYRGSHTAEVHPPPLGWGDLGDLLRLPKGDAVHSAGHNHHEGVQGVLVEGVHLALPPPPLS